MFKASVIVMKRGKEGGQRRPQSLSPGLCSWEVSPCTRLTTSNFLTPLINRSLLGLVTIESSRGAGGCEEVDEVLVPSTDLTLTSLRLRLCTPTHMYEEQKGVE